MLSEERRLTTAYLALHSKAWTRVCVQNRDPRAGAVREQLCRRMRAAGLLNRNIAQ